jgi:RES domain-containing protein
MIPPDRVHDRAILDALEALEPATFEGSVWRIARKGRDPLRGSAAKGRWTPNQDCEVLYTSLKREGALAEVGFRLSLEPVWPTKLEHQIHEISVQVSKTIHIADVKDLTQLGVDVGRYESFDYLATQAIAAAAHFLEFDGLLVPSARAPCSNLVLFLDRISDGAHLDVVQSMDVDWNVWRGRSQGRKRGPRYQK